MFQTPKMSDIVSTHSRLEAADSSFLAIARLILVSTHSRLEAAEFTISIVFISGRVSTHSRLEAADSGMGVVSIVSSGFNTQPPRGG